MEKAQSLCRIRRMDDRAVVEEVEGVRRLSAVGSPARAGTVCPRFHRMFALTHSPLRTSACSIQYIGLSLP